MLARASQPLELLIRRMNSREPNGRAPRPSDMVEILVELIEALPNHTGSSSAMWVEGEWMQDALLNDETPKQRFLDKFRGVDYSSFDRMYLIWLSRRSDGNSGCARMWGSETWYWDSFVATLRYTHRPEPSLSGLRSSHHASPPS